MAGSSNASHFLPDPSLHSRLEGLKILAHCLSEPVVIFNPNMELVYANPSSERVGVGCPLLHQYDGGPNVERVEGMQCEPCPGKELFSGVRKEGENLKTMDSGIPSVNPSCPLPKAIPLSNESGVVQYAVMMGAAGRQSVVCQVQDHAFPGTESVIEAGKAVGGLHPDSPLIGESPPIQQLVEMIRLVAASEATVLIQGESGTGKELVAKTIHAFSRRRARPFVVVECSALPESILESELFGHARGAFTGAVAERKGLFEEAEGGTLFLDEIADTSPAFQARLLRVLQEGEIRPVGSNRTVKVNVRVISAGNKSIEDLVKAKAFRADLYYRLAVLPLLVPPLRERIEDIPLLVNHFLTESARKHGRDTPKISEEAVEALIDHQWPGNVRELENLIERVVVTCHRSEIQKTDLFGTKAVSTEVTPDALTTIGKAARRDAERLKIFEALQRAKGDKTKTARILKISRSTLYNKLREYKISS